jgi:hypothetical protein
MWLNIKWYDDAGTLVREDGAYGPLVDNDGNPVMITNPADSSMIQVESIIDLHDLNTKIYEAHYGIDQEWAFQHASLGSDYDLPLTFDRNSGTTEHTLGELASSASGTLFESFHFVLNNRILKDNRIPPYGMDYEKARLRNALPVPASQYSGGPGSTYNYFDTFALNAPQGATNATIDLLYQPTSWEYIQFLYLANKGTDPAQGGNAFLGMEGVNMLEAWINTGMASPYVMASTTLGTPPDACTALSPTLLTATPGDKQAKITWQEIPGDHNIVGYKVYYDQAGKAQLIVDLPQPANMYTDTGLTNGQEYCYKVTSYYSDTCESGFSNIICVIPNNQGQARIGIDNIDTGIYQRIGKGKKATVEFVLTNTFVQGDGVVIRALVLDKSTQQPVQNTVVEIEITGPEFVLLTTGPSDSNGIAETTWQTEKPNKRGKGGTILGAYTSTTTNVTATGYTWDGVLKNTTFTIE